jgi:hypothetical protein
MKIQEIILESIQQLDEGGDSTAKRFYSELGALTAWAGKGNDPSFDPKDPGQWLDADKIENPKKVFAEITRFLTMANDIGLKDPKAYGIQQYYEISKRARDLILQDMSSKGLTPPSKFSWVGGENALSVGATPSDVNFVDSDVAGVSIKDDGGIGVGNLGAGELEFEGKGDLFVILAPKEMFALKQAVMQSLLQQVKSQGSYEVPGKAYYNMKYDAENNKYQIDARGKVVAGTAEQLMDWGFLQKSNEYQRCLGAYYLENYSKFASLSNAVLAQTADKIRDAIEKKIIPNAAKLAKLGGFGSQPYYYQLAKPFKVAFVPNANTANDIEVTGITSPSKMGAGLMFLIKLRRRGVEGTATVEAHIRYAQGVFGSSPTFRIQSLKGHENLYWEVLTSKSSK